MDYKLFLFMFYCFGAIITLLLLEVKEMRKK